MNDWGETLVLSLAGLSLAGAVVLFLAHRRHPEPALLRWARVLALVTVTLALALVSWFVYLVLVVT